MTAGMTRTSAKVPAPLPPSALATTIAAAAAAAVETQVATTVRETLRTSFTVVLLRSRRPGPADEGLAGVALGPRLVERAVQVVRRADHELLGTAHRLERLLHGGVPEALHDLAEVGDEAPVGPDEGEPLADHLARVDGDRLL